MKPINTSIYDFPTLITGGYVYVDKTAQLYDLAKPGTDVLYYLPRPRRFGKSLMISTLKALFQGRRELFRGLKIERTDWDWEKVTGVNYDPAARTVDAVRTEEQGAVCGASPGNVDSGRGIILQS